MFYQNLQPLFLIKTIFLWVTLQEDEWAYIWKQIILRKVKTLIKVLFSLGQHTLDELERRKRFWCKIVSPQTVNAL